MSRKITDDAVRAFNNGYSFTRDNTRVEPTENGAVLYLHGSPIARRGNGKVEICDGGYNSLTTRERLNGLSGVRVNNKGGDLHLNGEPWDGEWKTV